MNHKILKMSSRDVVISGRGYRMGNTSSHTLRYDKVTSLVTELASTRVLSTKLDVISRSQASF